MQLVFSAGVDVKKEDKFEFPLTDLFHSEAGRFPAKHCEDRLAGDFVAPPTHCLLEMLTCDSSLYVDTMTFLTEGQKLGRCLAAAAAAQSTD